MGDHLDGDLVATVTLHEVPVYTRHSCCLCWATIEKDAVKALLNEKWSSVVCHDCLAAGPDGIGARLLQVADEAEAEAARRAAKLREGAEAHWVMPTLEEWADDTYKLERRSVLADLTDRGMAENASDRSHLHGYRTSLDEYVATVRERAASSGVEALS